MTQFHEGQNVKAWKEVRARGTELHQNYVRRWCKAKIVCFKNVQYDKECYLVQFPDGKRDVFDEGNIRAIKPTDEAAEIFRVGDPHP